MGAGAGRAARPMVPAAAGMRSRPAVALALAATLLAPALLIAGCKQEPTFDERYGTARDSIAKKAKALDAELARDEAARAAQSEAADGDAKPAPAPTTTPPARKPG